VQVDKNQLLLAKIAHTMGYFSVDVYIKTGDAVNMAHGAAPALAQLF
jgi:hypothetical protein